MDDGKRSFLPLNQYIAAILEAGSLDDVREQCAKFSSAFGFEHFFYGVRFPRSLIESVFLVVSDCPQEWCSLYSDKTWRVIDPTIRHCLTYMRPLFWDELETRKDDSARQFLKAGRNSGLTSGVTVPVRGCHGELGMLTLCCGDAHPATRHRAEAVLPELLLLATYLHETVCRLAGEDGVASGRQELTRRERECLLWIAEGKTSWETAQILGVSERTVIFHLQNVTEKLGAANRLHAVARAICQGVIKPSCG